MKGYDKHDQEATTNGCSCCSVDYNLHSETDCVIDELKQNIEMVFRLCAAMEWDADELIQKVKNEGKWKDFKKW